MNTHAEVVPDGYDEQLHHARVERCRDAAAELLDAVKMVPGGTGVPLVDATDWLVEAAGGGPAAVNAGDFFAAGVA